MFNLEEIAPCMYVMPKTEGMIVPGLIIASSNFLKDLDQEALKQVQNVAHLPGILGYSIAMPDIHWGYGFPIGGVAATDIENGVISPGGVGYDINCGVRIALIPELFSNFSLKTKKDLIECIYNLIPSGVGKGEKNKILSDKDYEKLLVEGSKWSINQGFGLERDLEHTESFGVIKEASYEYITQSAKDRGKDQLGTIGSGNHFVEIGEIVEILEPQIANLWNVWKGQTYILIHSGSRGFGHQVCQDHLNQFIRAGYAKKLPDKQLVCAPFQSKLGKQYFQSMSAAANYAFNNRQQILHKVRLAFQKICKIKYEDISLLYDVCHNIAKIEEHRIKRKKQKECVHRKGATRAFGPGAKELNPVFKKTGQPVLVPGDMARASFIMVGCGNEITFCSACHGAGRARSRAQSSKEWKHKDPMQYLQERGIIVKASSYKTIIEEMPDAYKDVLEVVKAAHGANTAHLVAKLKSHLVLKG